MYKNQGAQGQKSVKGGKSEKGVKGTAAQTFEELHVYQRARELTNAIYKVTRGRAFAEDRSLVDQIRRAATSIMFNIAEGFERGSKTEFIQFLFIAKGSSGEVRAQLQVARDQEFISAEDYDGLYNLARLVSGMLSNFIAHLQQTEYQGEKFARPQRQAVDTRQEHRERLRAAQEVNIRSQQERAEREQAEREVAERRGAPSSPDTPPPRDDRENSRGFGEPRLDNLQSQEPPEIDEPPGAVEQ